MKEHREIPRLRDQNSIAITVLSSENSELSGQTYFCATRDVSAGGIQVKTPIHVPKGVRVKLLLAVADPCCSFRLDGRTLWSRLAADGRSHLLGIEFANVSLEALAAWRVFVGQRLSKEKAI